MATDLNIINKKLDDLCQLITEHFKLEENKEDELVDIHGASAILNKPETAIRQMVHRGQLSCVKLDNNRLFFRVKYLKGYYASRIV